MESSGNKKRGYDYEHVEDPSVPVHESKKPKLPALASVVVEALKLDSLQKLCSSLEPLIRRVVSEEVERALTKFTQAKLSGRIQCSEGKNLQLQFRTRMPPHLFTGGKVEGEQGAAIHAVLIDADTGHLVQTGPESAAKLNVVVLEGDFNEEADEDWTKEHFESHEVKEREGKRPILTGDFQVSLKEGVGTIGELTFNDNSSWIRSRKFRLGVKIAPGFCEGTRVREAKTEAFVVKDHRGELYKKHYPPALHDEVWRLDRIAKDGALHKKLVMENIETVEDFLRLLVREPQKLRRILGSGMSNRMWENTVEHAKTCVLGGKLYIYYADESYRTGVVFNHIYELRGLLAEGQFISLESLNHNQKILVDSLVKSAYENWNRVVEYDGEVLNSLSSVKKGIKPLTLPTLQNNCTTDQYNATAQNRQPYISQEQNLHYQPESNHPSAPNLIEFPLVRSDQSAGQTLNNSQTAFPSSTAKYWPIGTPGLAACYTPGDWTQMRNREEMEDLFAEEVRERSTEMLQSEDIQRLLGTLSMEVGVGMGTSAHYKDGDCFSYGVPYDAQRAYNVNPQEHGRSSGKAVVGWLKLKAALRWGIFIRKKAAERRARLVELDDH